MVFFKNLRIRARLIISFSVVTIFAAILSIVGCITIEIMGSNYEYIQTKPTERLNSLNIAYSEFLMMRYRAANFVMNSDGDLYMINDVVLPQYIAARDSLYYHLNEYLRLNKEDTRLDLSTIQKNDNIVQSLKELVGEYTVFVDEVLALSRLGYTSAADDILFSAVDVSNNIMNTIQELARIEDSYIDNLLMNTHNQKSMAEVFLIFLTIFLVAISVILAFFIGASISKPLLRLSEAASHIAAGKLDVILSSNAKDEIGDLTRDLQVVTDTINDLIKSMESMAKDHERGEIDSRIQTSQFKGSYMTVAEGVNDMVGATINRTLMFLNCMTEFSNGNFDADIPHQPGKKALMNKTLNSMRDNLKLVLNDIGQLIDNVKQGDLSKRVDSSKYSGDWATLLEELNSLMKVITDPIYEISQVMNEVSVGNFQQSMTGDYQGDFLMIKNSVNETVVNIASYIYCVTKRFSNQATSGVESKF